MTIEELKAMLALATIPRPLQVSHHSRVHDLIEDARNGWVCQIRTGNIPRHHVHPVPIREHSGLADLLVASVNALPSLLAQAEAADALAKAVDAALDDATLAPHAVEEMLRAALSAYRRAGGAP